MIKSKPPRPKPVKSGDGGGDGGADRPKTSGGSSGGGSAAKKRRPSQKKKETADGVTEAASGSRKRSIGGVVLAPSLSSSSTVLHQEEHRRYYQRAPRLLPDIDGVRSLSASEVAADLKLLQSSLTAFDTKLHGHLPTGTTAGGGVYLHGNKTPAPTSTEDAYASFLQQKGGGRRLTRLNGVITPEEVVESLPACRRAVRITQRELAAMKRERDDLERDFMRQRCRLLWQMGEMKRIQKQHDRALHVLSSDVVRTAKSLASSRRRTNALQDIMTELDARGSAVVRLTREKHQLETLLKKHGIALPEPDEIYVGDRVSSPFGEGRVQSMDDVKRVIAVELDNELGVAYVQEKTVEVLPTEISYATTEKELKAKLFDKIGALVQPNGRFSFLAGGGGATGRRRSRGGPEDDDSDGDLINDVLNQADGDHDDEDDEDDDTMENGVGEADDEHSGRRSVADGDLDAANDDENRKRPAKKRKLMVPASVNAKKKQKNSKVFDFTACKIPITPYDVGLLLSPLSVLPERVAAVGPDALQWLSSYLPAKMADWEQDRYHALQMQGEIERLRFQLQKAEDDKEDAHTLAVEQVDSMNDLVRQIEKLREQLGVKEAKEGCSTCTDPTPGSSKKASSSTSRQIKSNGRANTKSSNRRQRSESIEGEGEGEGDDEDTEGSSTPAEKDASSNTKSAREESDALEENEARKEGAHGHDDDDFGDDGGESSDASKPAVRSLRPRRGSGNSTTSQSSVSTSNATSKTSK